jgi:hypothetical protein
MEALVELCPNYWVELSPASGAGRHMVGISISPHELTVVVRGWAQEKVK